MNWTTRVKLGDRLCRLAISLTLRRHEDRGATAVEYALMLALIAVVIVGAVTLLGESTSGSFDEAAAGFGGS